MFSHFRTTALAVAAFIIPLAGIAQAGTTEIPLAFNNGVYFALATVNGTVPAAFIVDSGAAGCTISPAVARQLSARGSLTPADLVDAVTLTNADGTKRPALRWRLHTLTVGNFVLRNVVCAVGQDEGTALLGQAVLRRFAAWSINNRRNVLTLESAQ